MKKILLTVAILIAAQTTYGETSLTRFPNEVSALISSSKFTKAMKEAKKTLEKGYELSIVAYGSSEEELSNGGVVAHPYIVLEKKRVSMFPVQSFNLGKVTSTVRWGGVDSDYIVEDVNFELAETPRPYEPTPKDH